MRKVSGFLAIIVVLIWLGSYNICEYFFPDDLDKWQNLRHTLKNSNYLFLVALIYLPKTIISKSLMAGFTCLVIGDLIDRVFLNTTTFVVSDWVLITCSVVAAILVYKRESRFLD